MKLAIMQPYLFPYIGYFQMMHAVNMFVLLDDVNYIKQGWVNRNRILLNGKDHFLTVPIKNASQNKHIIETFIHDDNNWKSKMLKTVEFAYKHAPNFNSVFPLVESIIKNPEKNISKFNLYSLTSIAKFLDIRTQIIDSSTIYKNSHLKAQDKIINICRQENKTQYINSYGGNSLYSKESFKANNIDLFFIKPGSFEYKQFSNEFIPCLSIIDTMMFVTKEKIQSKLSSYSLY